jgi:hypothetical protein
VLQQDLIGTDGCPRYALANLGHRLVPTRSSQGRLENISGCQSVEALCDRTLLGCPQNQLCLIASGLALDASTPFMLTMKL